MNYQKLLSKFNYMHTDTVVDDDYFPHVSHVTDLNSLNQTPDELLKCSEYQFSQKCAKNGEESRATSSSDIFLNSEPAKEIEEMKVVDEIRAERPIVELLPEETRWFYKAIQDKSWLEFTGYDSLRIEKQYREIFPNIRKHIFTQYEDTQLLAHIQSNDTKECTQIINGNTTQKSASDVGCQDVNMDISVCEHQGPELTNNTESSKLKNIKDIPTCSGLLDGVHFIKSKIPKIDIDLIHPKHLPRSNDNNSFYTNTPAVKSDPSDVLIGSSLIQNGFKAGYNFKFMKETENEVSEMDFDVACSNNQNNNFDHLTINNKNKNNTKNIPDVDNITSETIKKEKCNIASGANESRCTESNDQAGKENGSSDPTRIVVRGGMYEVDLINMSCESIYWPGEQCMIIRGTFFYDGSWQPLEMEPSSLLEDIHLNLFGGKMPSEYTTENSMKVPVTAVLHTEHFPDFHVAWLSPHEIYLYSENAPSKIVRSVTHRLGFQKSTGYRLRRGYRITANMSDEPQGVSHLVFVIHGIGQKMDSMRIIRNTGAFRECCDWLKNKYFPSSNHRAEFFPVEWRASLKLDHDMVDAITPHNVMSIRHLLNCSAMDIMYYSSPLYGSEVQRGLTEELNRLHSMFLARNPNFKGPVSILAHSLGCVILYDIITKYQPGTCRTCECKSKNIDSPTNTLNFTIDKFFCLGSPLSVFIALRHSGPTEEQVLPDKLCNGMYNIFHLSDPIAYRMEPLLSREYRKIAPLIIQPYALAVGGVKYNEMPLEIIQGQQQVRDSGSESPSPVNTPQKGTWKIWSYVKTPWKQTEAAAMNSSETESNAATNEENPKEPGPEPSTSGTSEHTYPQPKNKLSRRFDYILRETGLAKNYWSAITSHTSYWTNYDVAFFILSKLFPDFENEVEESSEIFESFPI